MTTTNDRRQAIQNELVNVLTGLVSTIQLTGGETPASLAGFVHNRNELPKEMVPGIILLDGDERMDQRIVPPTPGRLQVKLPTQFMILTPEIYVVLDVRKPANLNVGADLNICRLAILGAIWDDATLQTIVGSNGKITVDAVVSDLARNRVMQGQLGISIGFHYPLIAAEIIGR
jgi:hypothetical protein